MSHGGFHDAALTGRRAETALLTRLEVEGPARLHAAHERPGQYLALRVPGQERPGHLVIASLPGEPRFEFLLREGGAFASALLELPLGGSLALSLPQGRGFPFEDAEGRAVWLLSNGAGIAALRPLVGMLLRQEGGPRELHLILGARTRGDVPFPDERDAWSEQGVAVHLALSREAGEPGPGASRGYVHRVLGDLRPDLADATVFACGSTAMLEAAREQALGLGLPATRFHTNQ